MLSLAVRLNQRRRRRRMGRFTRRAFALQVVVHCSHGRATGVRIPFRVWIKEDDVRRWRRLQQRSIERQIENHALDWRCTRAERLRVRIRGADALKLAIYRFFQVTTRNEYDEE